MQFFTISFHRRRCPAYSSLSSIHLIMSTGWNEWIICDSQLLSSVQSLSCVQLFVTPWTVAHPAFLSITNSQSLLKLMSIESVADGFSTTEPLGNSLRLSAAAAKLLQLCPTLWPQRRQPTRLPLPWDSPARTLEWVAISFSNAGKWKVKVKLLSRVRLLVTPWTAAYQDPPSMGFPRQEHWSGVPLPSLRDIL